jgi:hypothetical protein
MRSASAATVRSAATTTATASTAALRGRRGRSAFEEGPRAKVGREKFSDKLPRLG